MGNILLPDTFLPATILKLLLFRRRNFVDKLLQQYENNSQQQKLGMTTPEVVNKTTRRHLVVVPSSSKQYMVEKIPYFPYRPATDLRYLTGHTEPNSALIVDVDPQGAFRSI